jgi:hypothetical protein
MKHNELTRHEEEVIIHKGRNRPSAASMTISGKMAPMSADAAMWLCTAQRTSSIFGAGGLVSTMRSLAL